jgi:chromosome partitioning protein
VILACVGQKGGTGKTTTAISVAVEFVARGRKVLLVDTDPQGSVLTWADVAVENGAEHTPAVCALGAQLRQQLAPHREAYDVVVIDCPPQHGERQRAALMVADVAILPSGPDPTEVWGITASADLVREAMAVRPALRVAVLITRTDRRTVLGATSRGTLEALALPVLEAQLSRRVTYPEAIASGRGPTSYDPRSVAAREVKRLVTEMENLGGMAPVKKGGAR